MKPVWAKAKREQKYKNRSKYGATYDIYTVEQCGHFEKETRSG